MAQSALSYSEENKTLSREQTQFATFIFNLNVTDYIKNARYLMFNLPHLCFLYILITQTWEVPQLCIFVLHCVQHIFNSVQVCTAGRARELPAHFSF